MVTNLGPFHQPRTLQNSDSHLGMIFRGAVLLASSKQRPGMTFQSTDNIQPQMAREYGRHGVAEMQAGTLATDSQFLRNTRLPGGHMAGPQSAHSRCDTEKRLGGWGGEKSREWYVRVEDSLPLGCVLLGLKRGKDGGQMWKKSRKARLRGCLRGAPGPMPQLWQSGCPGGGCSKEHRAAPRHPSNEDTPHRRCDICKCYWNL